MRPTVPCDAARVVSQTSVAKWAAATASASFHRGGPPATTWASPSFGRYGSHQNKLPAAS
eukprot:1527595-Lingulodinium_polyedra.AAC.1